jgi:hypothetical protein
MDADTKLVKGLLGYLGVIARAQAIQAGAVSGEFYRKERNIAKAEAAANEVAEAFAGDIDDADTLVNEAFAEYEKNEQVEQTQQTTLVNSYKE